MENNPLGNKLKPIEELKIDAQEKIDLQNCKEAANRKKYGDFWSNRHDLEKEFERMNWESPQRIYEVILHWENVLEKAEKKHGKDSDSYKIYINTLNSLWWSIRNWDAVTMYHKQVDILRLENQALRDRVIIAERELQKYTTIEELIFHDTLDDYKRAVVERMKAVAEKNPGLDFGAKSKIKANY